MEKTSFSSLPFAVLTVSDTRSLHDDVSGSTLVHCIEGAGHTIIHRQLVKDNIYHIRSVVSQWIADDLVQVILLSGGTGFFGSDVTPEAVSILFDKDIAGFGELFRSRSYEEIGTSTMQSRVCAGIANTTLIFVLPGSPHACKTAWALISEQLDSTKKRCNFVKVLKSNI